MQIGQVAAQLYTLRDFTKTPAEIATTLKKVRAIGYEAVQASAMGPISEEELVRMLDGEGLTLCATHESPEMILDEPQAVVERLKKLGCRYTAYPYPRDIPMNTLDDVKAFAGRLDRAGRVLQEVGLTLTYHNHQIEFRKVGGRTILETLYAETGPRSLQGEIDTYWVQYGGGDCVAWCKKLAGRLPLLHIKDYRIDSQNNPIYAEIGAGNLDWTAIINAAEASGCEWFIVEQDTCPGDPFDSLAKSFAYLQENVAR